MNHIIDIDNQKPELFEIFKKIQDSNTILFLGAGTSVGEKRYLSRELIDYYQAKIGKDLKEQNITAFIDILSADPTFSRVDFDNFVVQLLKKLEVTEAHKILASIPWREIITTNYDLLVEKAYDAISSTYQKGYDLKVIRNNKEYNYRTSNSEIRYIKLNGCMQDKGQYPLAFSTDDFNKLKQFYKTALHDLKNISPEIQFLSIGYSFSDAFGTDLLKKFDSYNFRDKKWMINVDPFPNDAAFPYFTQNKICIVRCSFENFFSLYKDWETQQDELLVRKKSISVTNSNGEYISLPPRLLLNLEGIIKQLNTNTRDVVIKESDFYKGEEPTFNLIVRGADVIKVSPIQQTINKIHNILSKNHNTILPIFFITGDFGIGKSTFTLRLIYELEKNPDWDLVAFEIIDFIKVRTEHLIELINSCKAKNLIFYCDEVEIESSFKAVLEIQRTLSIEQFHDRNIFFIVPIRENILEKFKLDRTIPNSEKIIIDGSFSLSEIEDLLEKLKNSNLINYRDIQEKNRIIKKIQTDYGSDSFLTLMDLITSGKHENDLITSYNQLSKEAQKAFLYTALLHRYKLLMPASWLKQNISMSWDEFETKIIRAEGKGILLQELKLASKGAEPDLFFRTKHPLIAEKLVNRFIPSKDQQYSFYERMLKTIETGQTNSFLANNLLKMFSRTGEYSSYQTNKLYDAAYTKLSDDPYFLLNFAINLQSRKTKEDLVKALSILIYAEAFFDKRMHKFIHRRGVITFDLAKLSYDEGNFGLMNLYLDDAEDLFVTKQLLDPFSSFSYADYIKLLIWEIENIGVEEEVEIEKRIHIEELLDLAFKTVIDNIDKINNLKTTYAGYLKTKLGDVDYKEYLDELYQSFKFKPYACILLFNYYDSIRDYDSCQRMIDEMEYYLENFEVIKFLFKYYGRNLHIANIRVKFLKLSRDNNFLEKNNPLRYYYFNFIAESYNHHFQEGRNYLSNIQAKYFNINPEFQNVWLDSEGEELYFDGKIVSSSNGRYKSVKVYNLQMTFRLIKGQYEKFSLGSSVKIKLHFFLYGLMAEIIQTDDEQR